MAYLKQTNIKKHRILELLLYAIYQIDPNVKTGLDSKHDAQKEWLVNVYYRLNPGDPIFNEFEN